MIVLPSDGNLNDCWRFGTVDQHYLVNTSADG
jgi:hypothetical protein